MDINLELKRYAAGFAYHLIKSLEKPILEKIDSIILFGSVSQERADKDSDADLFINARLSRSGMDRLKSAIVRELAEFQISNEGLFYKSRGIYNEIRPVVGDLSKWPEMKNSISSSGIVLYGPYKADFSRKGLKKASIFFWESAKSRGAFLNKIYGFRIRRKKYSGEIERLGGTKIGKSAALIPSPNDKKFMKVLEKYKVNYRIKEVFV